MSFRVVGPQGQLHTVLPEPGRGDQIQGIPARADRVANFPSPAARPAPISEGPACEPTPCCPLAAVLTRAGSHHVAWCDQLTQRVVAAVPEYRDRQ